jgi:flagellar assembly protein FliH
VEEVYVIDPDQPAAKKPGHSRVGPSERAALEAKRILQSAQEQAEILREQARQSGYQDGQQRAVQENADAAAELERLNQAVQEERDAFFVRIEPEVVKLSVEVAEKILRRELASSPESVLDIVKSALQQLRDKDSIKLRVNPADLELLKANRQALCESVDGIQHMELIEDRRVDRGGCIAESSNGSLDARTKSQLSEAQRVLTEAAGDDAGSADAGSEQIQQDTEPNEYA